MYLLPLRLPQTYIVLVRACPRIPIMHHEDTSMLQHTMQLPAVCVLVCAAYRPSKMTQRLVLSTALTQLSPPPLAGPPKG